MDSLETIGESVKKCDGVSGRKVEEKDDSILSYLRERSTD